MSFTSLSPSDLQRIFEKLDRNGDGLVSLGELNWLLERIGVQDIQEDLENLVGNTTLNFTEFLAFYDSICSRRRGETDQVEEEDDGEGDLVKAFKVFDLNGDGVITSGELQRVLSRLGMLEENGGDYRSMIKFYDTNSDGVLDFEEFKNMMIPSTI